MITKVEIEKFSNLDMALSNYSLYKTVTLLHVTLIKECLLAYLSFNQFLRKA